MATTVDHLAIQLSNSIEHSGATNVLVTGGGALNLILVKRLKHYSRAKIFIPEESIVQYKEALIFAFLGLLKYRGDVNCLASVTGGKSDLSTGTIHTV